ncbi:MAG: CYTH domain-containing protein [bacterium]|nr:CYTH domain-containing protein [bacterium]
MIEGRAIISDIQETRNKLEALEAVFRGNYVFRDIIFVPKKKTYNLNDDFLRVRIQIKSHWSNKKIILVRKQTEFGKVGKVNNVMLRREFDSEKEAVDFVEAELGSQFARSFEYTREGWQYNLEGSRIFVEAIAGFRPSVEIEADSEDDIRSLYAKIGILEEMHESIPEVMRRILAARISRLL